MSNFFSTYVPIKDRQDVWGDVTPIKQYDTPTGEAPICPTQYTPEYQEASGYFRAILQSGELSQRALDLTVDVLRFNPGDYDAWTLRRKIYDHLQLPLFNQNSITIFSNVSFLYKEIEFLNEIGLFLEKNFQIWHHRRCIMEIYQDGLDAELEFLDEYLFWLEVFESDAKNYHAWSYRLWFIEKFQLWNENEWDYVNEELKDQVTNNSIWSYRYFLTMKTKPYSVELVREEIQYALEKLKLDYANEAAWVYLRGYLASTKAEAERSQNDPNFSNARRWFILDFPELKQHLVQLLESGDQNFIGNRFIYSVLVDFAEAEGSKDEAVKHLELLKKIDRMRENFYQWKINNLLQ